MTWSGCWSIELFEASEASNISVHVSRVMALQIVHLVHYMRDTMQMTAHLKLLCRPMIYRRSQTLASKRSGRNRTGFCRCGLSLPLNRQQQSAFGGQHRITSSWSSWKRSRECIKTGSQWHICQLNSSKYSHQFPKPPRDYS